MVYRITVVGAGYLGATHAACLAELGFEVLGMDVDATKVAALSEGRLPCYEPGLEPLLRKHIESGRLRFTTSYGEVADFGDVHFLCVGTPQRQDSFAADLSYLDAAVEGLAPHLNRTCLLVGKSTVPVGTADRLASRVVELAPAGELVEVAWNPEFLREGHGVADTLAPDRMVLGIRTERAERVLREIYAAVITAGAPVVVTDFSTAELVKSAANAFLTAKISFINAMAEVCEATGADVTQLAAALAHDPRIGGRFLHAGLGFGGGCLPKDLRAFIARVEELGVDAAVALLQDVDAINTQRRTRMIDLAREQCDKTFTGRRIGVLGAAFKPNSDDIRDSPALHVAAAIQRLGAQVTVYDPKAMDNARAQFPLLSYADSAVEAANGAHLVLHLTEWQEFRDMDPVVLSAVVAQKRMVDGRNALDPAIWRSAGWTYRALGRP